jgi:hypothetical protein
MNARLKPLICWPERDELRKTMPMSFRTNFGTRVAAIVDCFEIFIDRPSNLMARAQTWSSYKHMIGITPQGVISFISSGYGGRASDKMITENCGFLNKLLPGDLVLTDRGFDIRESVGVIQQQMRTILSVYSPCRPSRSNSQWVQLTVTLYISVLQNQ